MWGISFFSLPLVRATRWQQFRCCLGLSRRYSARRTVHQVRPRSPLPVVAWLEYAISVCAAKDTLRGDLGATGGLAALVC